MPTQHQRRMHWRAIPTLPLAGVLLALTASSALAQSPSNAPLGAIDHPTGSTDIILSMETGGGLVPFGYLVSQAPTFVLYGDGTAIFRPSEPVEDGQTSAPFVRAELSSDQVDALLTYALTEGRLADAAPSYSDRRIADAPTTLFAIHAAGIAKLVSVYALGIGAPEGPDSEFYAAFEDLATLLATFEKQVAAGNVVSAELYQPELYRVVLSEVDPSVGEVIAWPWTDLSPADFTPFPDNASWMVLGLNPEQLAMITTVPSGGGTGPTVSAPDGSAAYRVFWRPLLPGEDVVPSVTGGKGY